MERKVQDGLKIQRKRYITRFIKRLHSIFLIYLNEFTCKDKYLLFKKDGRNKVTAATSRSL